jgi:hypothetical protein
MSEYIKKNKILLIAFLILMSVSVWIRTYHYQDWLYFKMDQSRDALMIANAVKNGPADLPLLGARAGATELKQGFLRLGPAFYYFQYISGKVFNSTEPYVFAYPDLFFSLAVLPLIYFFLRSYFSRKNSFLILAMYSFSFIVVQYSRFAWNPNSLPFFMILAFLGLLKFLNAESVKGKIKWVAISTFGLSIGSQLHFFGFFSLLGITGLMILVHYRIWKKDTWENLKRSEVWKKIALFLGAATAVFMITYIPVIISDTMKNGQNTKNFFEAMISKPANKPLIDKIKEDAAVSLNYYCLTTTSYCYQSDMKKSIPFVVPTAIILILGLGLIIFELKKKPIGMKRDFLWLVLIWFSVFSILTVPVSFQLRPRFFLVVFLIPFIFLGLLYQFLEEKFGKKALYASGIITAAVLLSNATGIQSWFKEQADSQSKRVSVKRTLILKTKDGVTLGQLKGAADYIYANRKNDNNIYFYVKPEHVRPFQYLFYSKNDLTLHYYTLKLNEDPKAQYFAIVPAKKDAIGVITKKYGDTFDVVSQKQFGQLMVFEINFRNRNISSDFRFNKEAGKTDRIFWKDVFGIKRETESGIKIDDLE